MEDSVNAAAAPQPDIAADGWDAQAYASMRDEIEYWKKRATESDEALERISNDLSPTHMGEPVLTAPQPDVAPEPLNIDDARLALWQAIKNIKIGNKTDDKLILDELSKLGYWVAKMAPSAPAEVEREALARADKACGVIRALLDGKTEYWAGQIRQQLGHVRTEIGLMLEGRQARAQLGAAPEPHPVFKFLLGEGELEGLWFGDRCDGRPAFWWRHHLRAALAAQPAQEKPHD